MFLIKINGKKFTSWKAGALTKGFKNAADGFSLTIIDGPKNDKLDLPPELGSKIEFYIPFQSGGSPILFFTGYVEEDSRALNASSRSFKITGRSKMGLAIDSSAIYKTANFKKQKIDFIAEELLKPFGIKTNFKTDPGKAFKSVTIEQGESVFDVISRLSKDRGLNLMSDFEGNLVFFRKPPQERTILLTPESGLSPLNIKRSIVNRFSNYVLRSYTTEAGSKSFSARAASSDLEVQNMFYKPKLITLQGSRDLDELEYRANIEAMVRAGRSVTATGSLPTFYDENKSLIYPGVYTKLYSPILKLDDNFIISKANYKFDARGGSSLDLSFDTPESLEDPESLTLKNVNKE